MTAKVPHKPRGYGGDGRRVKGGNEEYKKYHASTKMKKERAARNRNRRIYEAKNGDLPTETELDHIRPVRSGGGNGAKNLRPVSRHFNRTRPMGRKK